MASARQPQRFVHTLSEAQVEALLAAPDVATALGLRERTMLELMYPLFQGYDSVAVNADFDKFGIDSVDVQLHYDKSNPPTVAAFHFTKPDDVGHFVSDTVNGDLHYTYSFTVNYKDESQAYQSPVTTTEDAQITINVGQLGILWVNMLIGSVDFAKTPPNREF